MNRFLDRHPALGAVGIAALFIGAVVIGGMIYEAAPKATAAIAFAILFMMTIAGNRHFS